MTNSLVDHSTHHETNPTRRSKRSAALSTRGALTVYAETIGQSLEHVEAFVVLLELEANETDLERWSVEELREAASAIRNGVSAMRAEALLAGEGRKRVRRRRVSLVPPSGTLRTGSAPGESG